MKIILDTCILRKDTKLGSKAFKALINYCRVTASTIVLPEIVLQEIAAVYKRELESRQDKITKEIGEINLFLSNKLLKPSIRIEDEVKLLTENIKEKLSVFNLDIPKYNGTFLEEIVFRYFNELKPFSLKNAGFCDTLLWLTIKDYVNTEYEDFVFISNNIHDFSDKEGRELNPSLQDELAKAGKNLIFFKSLEDFLKMVEVKIGFITEEWLDANLDWKKMEELFRKEIGLSVHVTWFYELFSKQPTNHDLNYYDVEILSFKQRVYDLNICSRYNEKEVKVFFNLVGELLIHFFTDHGSTIKIRVPAYTSYDVQVKENTLMDTRDSLWEEESGLFLDSILSCETIEKDHLSL